MESELSTTPLALSGESAPPAVQVFRPFFTVACLVAADVTALIISLIFATVIRNKLIGGGVTSLPGILIPAVVLALCSFVASRLYPAVCENPVEELRRLVLAVTLTYLSLAASTFLFGDMSQSRLTFLLAWGLGALLAPASRSLVRALFASSPWWGSPVVVLGAGQTGKAVLKTLTNNPRLGLRPLAVLDDDPTQYEDFADSLDVGPLSRSLELARDHKVSYAIVCMPSLSRRDLLKLLDRYGHCFAHVMVIPDLIGMASLGLSVREVGGIIGLEVTQKLLRPSAQFVKRSMDVLITFLLAPLVLLIVGIAALLIKLESPGPVLFANERVGYCGRRFITWKLRSMVVDGDQALNAYLLKHPEERVSWEKTQKLKGDPRITRIGQFIRKASIDELPQLWNVLRGDMSLVGPRPMLESQVPLYGPAYVLYKRVRPGITGLWQISGRNHLTFSERASLDAYTIQNWSGWLDIYILARTISTVLFAKGAY